MLCKISFSEINKTTNNPLSSFGSLLLHTLIHADDANDAYCPPSYVLMV